MRLPAHQISEPIIERVLIALRALTEFYEFEGSPTRPAVEALLRLVETEQERKMAIDDLACLVIRRELPDLTPSQPG